MFRTTAPRIPYSQQPDLLNRTSCCRCPPCQCSIGGLKGQGNNSRFRAVMPSFSCATYYSTHQAPWILWVGGFWLMRTANLLMLLSLCPSFPSLQHFRGRKNRCYSLAYRAVRRAFVYATKARLLKKRDTRTVRKSQNIWDTYKILCVLKCLKGNLLGFYLLLLLI